MRHALAALLATTGALFFLGACSAAPAKHYAISGEVISVDVAAKMITLNGEEIPGLMPAMTMSYQVADAKEIEKLGAGDKISADLVVAEGKSHLEKIVLVQKTGKNPPAVSPAPGAAPKDGAAEQHKHPGQ
ncbi:MAG: copper-binding protein [Acidobacteriia bacterium]|nr:copper-binding protein [Terriglobia bacterium]